MAESAGELVAACVGPRDLRPSIDPATGALLPGAGSPDVSASEAAALELALEVAEAWGAEPVALCAPGPDVDPAEVGALGEFAGCGGRVVVVETGLTPERVLVDEAALARALAGALAAAGRPALVCFGDRSELRGTGALPALVAAELGLVQVLGCSSVELAGPGRLAVERRLEQGWKERLVVHAPAVVAVEPVRRLRRAPLQGMLAGAPAVVRHRAHAGSPTVEPGGATPLSPLPHVLPPPAGADPLGRLAALSGVGVRRDPPRIVTPAGPAEAAGELAEFLERHGVGS